MAEEDYPSFTGRYRRTRAVGNPSDEGYTGPSYVPDTAGAYVLKGSDDPSAEGYTERYVRAAQKAASKEPKDDPMKAVRALLRRLFASPEITGRYDQFGDYVGGLHQDRIDAAADDAEREIRFQAARQGVLNTPTHEDYLAVLSGNREQAQQALGGFVDTRVSKLRRRDDKSLGALMRSEGLTKDEVRKRRSKAAADSAATNVLPPDASGGQVTST